MYRKVGFISLIALINLIGWINLARAEEAMRDYDLKINLKPKIIESKVYWQERERINWQEEINNWNFGFLSSKEDLPLIIIYGNNFYPREENNLVRYRWMSNNAWFLVLNPLNAKVKANLLFEADSFKKNRRVKILVNKEEIDTIVVPRKDEFSQFNIKEIILEPGINDVVFFSLEGAERLRLESEAWQQGRGSKNVSIKIRDNIKVQVLSKSPLLGSTAKYKYAISNEGLDIFTYFKKKENVFLVSRDLDIGLEEYPFINFDLDGTRAKIDIYFGINYSGNEKIDAYLAFANINYLKGVNLFELAKDNWQEADYFRYGFRLKKTILLIRPEDETTENSQKCFLRLKNLEFYNDNSLVLMGKEFNEDQLRFEDINVKSDEKFPYPIKSEAIKERFISLLKEINSPLLKIDDTIFYLNDFENWQGFNILEGTVLSKRIQLTKGNHNYKKLKNSTFNIEWSILESATNQQSAISQEDPQITFKKINPTKYLVKVKGAKSPFWLVFSESYHKEWRLYNSLQSTAHSSQQFDEIVADYPMLKVKEAKHLMRVTPGDIQYLFIKPLDASHQLVNGYANGWYIEPKKLGLDEDFTLAIYFRPQSLFYVGLMISGITFIICIGFLVYSGFREKATKN